MFDRFKYLFKNLITLVSDLSLPLVFGSVITYSFFAKIHNQIPDKNHLFLLGSAVFVIYLFDHLRECVSSKPSDSNQSFYLLYKTRWIWIVIGILLIFTSIYVLYLSFYTLKWQPIFIILVLTKIYFFIERIRFFSFLNKIKEALIAFVLTMTLGFLPAWSSNEIHYSYMLLLFLLSFQSINIFSWVDYESDVALNKQTLATKFGLHFVVWTNDIFSLISFAIIGDTWSEEGFSVALLVFILMQLSVLVLRFMCEFNKPKRVYRFWADMVFVLPLVYFLLT